MVQRTLQHPPQAPARRVPRLRACRRTRPIARFPRPTGTRSCISTGTRTAFMTAVAWPPSSDTPQGYAERAFQPFRRSSTSSSGPVRPRTDTLGSSSSPRTSSTSCARDARCVPAPISRPTRPRRPQTARRRQPLNALHHEPTGERLPQAETLGDCADASMTVGLARRGEPLRFLPKLPRPMAGLFLSPRSLAACGCWSTAPSLLARPCFCHHRCL